MKYRWNEKYVNGTRVSNTTTDLSVPEETALRAAAATAITALQAIQSAALDTETAQIQAIKDMAGIQEKLINFIVKRFL